MFSLINFSYHLINLIISNDNSKLLTFKWSNQRIIKNLAIKPSILDVLSSSALLHPLIEVQAIKFDFSPVCNSFLMRPQQFSPTFYWCNTLRKFTFNLLVIAVAAE